MTREEIEKLQAGRELDALIAEKVMGIEPVTRWIWTNNDGKSYFDIFDTKQDAEEALRYYLRREPGTVVMPLKIYPDYSTNIADAWQVIEKLRERRMFVQVTDCLRDEPWWACEFCDSINDFPANHAETAPLAIIRAALLVGMEV